MSDLDEDSQNTIKAAVNDHFADLVFVADGQNDETSLNQKLWKNSILPWKIGNNYPTKTDRNYVRCMVI